MHVCERRTIRNEEEEKEKSLGLICSPLAAFTPKLFTNAQSRAQTGRRTATPSERLSMCLRCQHPFHTYLHLKGAKKDVPVTFSECQVRKEVWRRRERAPGERADLKRSVDVRLTQPFI